MSARGLAQSALVALAAALVLVAAPDPATALTQAPAPAAPALNVVAPGPDAYVSGPVVIRAVVVPPSADVLTMRFYLDGQLVCTIERPPFDCTAEAGPGLESHHVRVAAELADGRRLSRSVLTRGPDDGTTLFRVGVDAVEVTAIVTDRRGRYVRGLGRGDFTVREDGVPQQLVSFAAHEQPLEVVVAIDTSGSMTRALDAVKGSVKRFLATLRPTDAVTILGFNDSFFLVARRETDPAARLAAVDRLRAWGSTALYDAVIRSVDLAGRRPGRKAIVLFTDGADRSSRMVPEDARRKVEANDAVVYAIAQGEALANPELRKSLERFAESTGGRAFFERHAEDLDPAFTEIFGEISNQYVLGYVSTKSEQDGTWRRVEVEVTGNRTYRVRARDGYLAARPAVASR